MKKTIALCLIVIVFILVFGLGVETGAQDKSPAAPPAVETKKDEPILGQAELYYLRQALRCIKMTPQDLLYKKNRDPDMPYRLKCVDNMMANPIDVPFYTDKVARDLTGNNNTCSTSTHLILISKGI